MCWALGWKSQRLQLGADWGWVGNHGSSTCTCVCQQWAKTNEMVQTAALKTHTHNNNNNNNNNRSQCNRNTNLLPILFFCKENDDVDHGLEGKDHPEGLDYRTLPDSHGALLF